MREKGEISFEGERATLEWRNGKIYCDGYDVENEKVALALRGGYGQGIGVLMIAIDEMQRNDFSLHEQLDFLSQDLEQMKDDIEGYIPEENSHLTGPYLSFSEHVEHRLWVAENAQLHRGIWKRLIKDTRNLVLVYLASRTDIPNEYHQMLASHPESDVRRGIATNLATSVELLTLLAKDSDLEVCRAVIGNPNTPKEILYEFVFDEDLSYTVAWRDKLDQELIDHILKNGNSRARKVLAKRSESLTILEKLAHDQDPKVREAVARNVFISKELMKILSFDDVREVRLALWRHDKNLPIEIQDHLRAWISDLKAQKRLKNIAQKAIRREATKKWQAQNVAREELKMEAREL